MKLLKITLLLLLIFSSNIFAKESLIINILSIDAKEVKIEVINRSHKTIKFWQMNLQIFKNNKWVQEMPNISCPCGRKCMRTVFKIKPKESSLFFWKKTNNRCEKLYGEFRFGINENGVIAHSKSFEIKKDDI